MLRSMLSSQFQYQVRSGGKKGGKFAEFVHKLHVAWRIFFPEQPEVRTGTAQKRPAQQTSRKAEVSWHCHFSQCLDLLTALQSLLLTAAHTCGEHQELKLAMHTDHVAEPIAQGGSQAPSAYGACSRPLRNEPCLPLGNEAHHREGSAGVWSSTSTQDQSAVG